MKLLYSGFIFLLPLISGYAQSDDDSEKHRITLALGHTNVSQGVSNAETKWLFLASWSLDYDYWFSDKWAIGLHTDFITQEFEVEANLDEGEVIKRSSPIAPALMGLYKPTKHSTFLLGAGAEFAKEENLFLNRLGYEWGTEIDETWEVGFSLNYDFRWNAYDSYTLGFGISHNFRKKRNK
ncbi:hypothetical protein ACX0HA_11810 [Flavobacterium hauense]